MVEVRQRGLLHIYACVSESLWVGWMLGDVDMDDNYLRIICVELQLAIANVEYRYVAEFPSVVFYC